MLFALAFSAFLLTPAADTDQGPPLGKKTLVEITKDTPNAGGWYVLEYDYPIDQGDRLRIEVEPVRGAVVRLRAEVWRENGDSFHPFETGPQEVRKVSWSMAKPLPGSRARVRLLSDSTGKFQVGVSKVGGPPAADERDEQMKKLRAENADLRKQLKALKKEIAELRKQLANKKP
jgi:hypothetical protein